MQDCNTQRVFVNRGELNIGHLEFCDEEYIFHVNTQSRDEIMRFCFGEKTVIKSKFLFCFLDELLPARSRQDIIVPCGITPEDSKFEQLIKIATHLNVSRHGLWLALDCPN